MRRRDDATKFDAHGVSPWEMDLAKNPPSHGETPWASNLHLFTAKNRRTEKTVSQPHKKKPHSSAPQNPPPARPEREVTLPADLAILPIHPCVREDLAKLEIACDEAELEKLAKYLTYLLEVNKQFNLTAIREPEQAWRRHIVDSLTLLPFLTEIESAGPLKIIDVGTGGGLPGIPLAITLPQSQVSLLEATAKKVKFLQLCREKIPLTNVQVIAGRAETWGQNALHRAKYGAAVCRAMGPIHEVLECTLPFLKIGGVLLAMKGPTVEEELKTAGDALDLLGAGEIDVLEAYPEDFGQNTVIVRVVKERETPRDYPRPPGSARISPL